MGLRAGLAGGRPVAGLGKFPESTARFRRRIPHWVGRTNPLEPPMNELDLFTEALSRTDPAERAAFLDQACAGNPELRRRLEELLAGHAQAENPLDRPPVAPGEIGATVEQPTPSPAGESPPEGTTRGVRPSPIPMPHRHCEPEGSAPPAIAPTEHRTGRRHGDAGPARSQCHHGSGNGVPAPAQPGSRRTKGSATSSPAGTRWSR